MQKCSKAWVSPVFVAGLGIFRHDAEGVFYENDLGRFAKRGVQVAEGQISWDKAAPFMSWSAVKYDISYRKLRQFFST